MENWVIPDQVYGILHYLKLDNRRMESIILDRISYGKEEDYGSLIEGSSGIYNEIFRFLRAWFSDTDEIEMSTSGSTGVPKIIALKKEVMRKSADETCNFFNVKSSSSIHLCLPVRFIAGKMMLVRAIVSGANVQVEEPVSSPNCNFKEAVQLSAMTPAQALSILSNDPVRLETVNNLILGGAPVGSELKQLLQNLGTNCYSTFGMTETATHIALMKLNGGDKSDVYKSIGDAYFELDERQCLVVSSKNRELENLATNDVVELRDNQSFRWLGRWDNVINTGAIKLFPEELERKIQPYIQENYFFTSLPDVVYGEMVILVVEGTKRQLELKPLNKLEKPKRIFFVDQFSFTETGKIDRKNILKEIMDA